MKTELIVALIAGGVALVSAGFSYRSAGRSDLNARAIKQLEIDNDKSKATAQRQYEISRFSEPLARSAYDLQSRIYNVLKNDLIGAFFATGNDREQLYAVQNTVFLIAQFQCWSELTRRGIQFIDLGQNEKTRELLRLQDSIYSLWSTPAYSRVLRIFAGEQRAIGEALIQTDDKGLEQSECIGYGTFLKRFTRGANPLIDALRADVESMGTHGIDSATERLKSIQNALIDLLLMLDPEYIRFPADRRTKV